MSAIKNLVSHIVDYAGLFPPAKLPLAEVVDNYDRYLGSEYRWMLARLVIPASRLHELIQEPRFLASNFNWKISALVPAIDSPDEAFSLAMASIDDFNAIHEDNGRAVVDAIEIKAGNVDLIQQTAAQVPSTISAFLEIPHQSDPSELLSAIKSTGNNIFAKIRAGGVTADLIPPAQQVARFVAGCVKHDVGFKATAGLHHPIGGSYRLTYDPDPQFGNMFGFLNVFAASMFAFSGADESTIAAILQESNSENLKFKTESLQWQDLSVSAEQIATLRDNRVVSFGSCSFTEPTQELAQLGLLETQTA